MKIKTKLTFITCAIIIYIIALTMFHFDYEYARYEMTNESTIIIIATLLYLLIIYACYGIVNHIKKTKSIEKTAEHTEEHTFVSEPTKENIKTSTNNQIEETVPTNNYEDNQYIGTGIIGLKNYTDFCQIIGILAVLSGVLYIIYAIACSDYSSIFIILAIYLITGGIGCFILSALLKAITTITKAAKLYIDINEKEEEKKGE